MTIDASSDRTGGVILGGGGVNYTIGTLNISAPNTIQLNGATITVTNAFSLGSALTSPLFIDGGNGTMSVASGAPTFAGAVIRNSTFSGGATFTAANSVNLGNNSGITITEPIASGSRSRVFTGM